MIDLEMLLHGVVLWSGIFGAVGAGYLLYADTIIVHYSRFFRIIAVGLFVFAVTAPIIVMYAPELIHAVHALSALFISIGLYTLIREELQTEPNFESLSSDFTQDED